MLSFLSLFATVVADFSVNGVSQRERKRKIGVSKYIETMSFDNKRRDSTAHCRLKTREPQSKTVLFTAVKRTVSSSFTMCSAHCELLICLDTPASFIAAAAMMGHHHHHHYYCHCACAAVWLAIVIIVIAISRERTDQTERLSLLVRWDEQGQRELNQLLTITATQSASIDYCYCCSLFQSFSQSFIASSFSHYH